MYELKLFVRYLFIFLKAYGKYNSRNTKILARIRRERFVYLIPKSKLCISTFKHVSWVSTLKFNPELFANFHVLFKIQPKFIRKD